MARELGEYKPGMVFRTEGSNIIRARGCVRTFSRDVAPEFYWPLGKDHHHSRLSMQFMASALLAAVLGSKRYTFWQPVSFTGLYLT